MPRGLFFPCGFGMYTLLVSPQLNFPSITLFRKALRLFIDVPSIVRSPTPLVLEPGLGASLL